MKIGIANDHSAVEMKNELVSWLKENGYEVVNYGTDTSDSVDYPVYGEKLANAVVSGEVERGIAICGTGIGIGIACNKVRGIRCCSCSEPYSAEYSRRHNNANMLAFGGRVEYKEDPLKILDAYLDSKFEGGRHERRVNKIMELESNQ